MPCALRRSFRPGLSLTKWYRGGPARPASGRYWSVLCSRVHSHYRRSARQPPYPVYSSRPAIPLGGVTQQQHHRAYHAWMPCPPVWAQATNPPITFDEIARGLRAGLHRCAKPSDLPVEITILVRTVVDLEAANALGPTAPVTLLARAVDKIEKDFGDGHLGSRSGAGPRPPRPRSMAGYPPAGQLLPALWRLRIDATNRPPTAATG
jgi:hypothetical protein